LNAEYIENCLTVYDTRTHNSSLCKLYNYGVRDVAYEFFANYLTNRKHCTL